MLLLNSLVLAADYQKQILRDAEAAFVTVEPAKRSDGKGVFHVQAGTCAALAMRRLLERCW